MSVSIPVVSATLIAIAGEESKFPVRRIFCVGRNYAEHAMEMGHDSDREPPFFFTKPSDAAIASPAVLGFPLATADLHHEVELVVAMASGGTNIPRAKALDHVFGYAVGLDMTRRDLQATAKKMGRPWDMAKGFDESAPMSDLRRASDVGHPTSGAIVLKVDGEIRQQGDLNQQIWSVVDTIALLSTLVEIKGGDLIMTGTPSGVGKVLRGSRLVGSIAGIGEVDVTYHS